MTSILKITLVHLYMIKVWYKEDKHICKYGTMGRMTRTMGLLPDTHNCGLRMCRGCGERFPRHRLQRKPLDSDPGMHHGKRMTHTPWCMSRSLTRVAEYRSCHSQRMRNLKIYVSCKRPMRSNYAVISRLLKTAAITDHASARMYVLLVPRVSRQARWSVFKHYPINTCPVE